MNRKIRILIFSQHPLNNRTNSGNTFSNLLGGDEYEIAQIFCMDENPVSDICDNFFQITEKDILKNLLDKKHRIGRVVVQSKKTDIVDRKKNHYLRIAQLIKNTRFSFLFWLRNGIWIFNNWKSKDLETFVSDFKPDIIFYNIGSAIYLNRIILYLRSITSAKFVGYVWDDIYTLRQFSLSPFYWISRICNRYYIKKVVDRSDTLFCINEQIKEEYEDIFKKKFQILRKGVDTTTFDYKFKGLPLKIVYTGNIFSGRYKTLSLLAKSIQILNKDRIQLQLYITSGNKITDKIRKKIEIKDSAILLGDIPFDKIKSLQKEADILVNVDPFSIFDRYIWRLSFSTKIVDYFEAGRCILSIGWKGGSGQKYLLENDAAIIVNNKKEISAVLESILTNPDIISKYAKKSYEIGVEKHQIEIIRSNLNSIIVNTIFM